MVIHRAVSMKSILCFAFIVCAVKCTNIDLVTSRTLPDGKGRLGIYDGKRVSIQKFPYTVAINRVKRSPCSGAILSQNIVLTTGDCVYNKSLADLSVVAGSNDGVRGQKYNVKKISVHPKFDPTKKDFDLDYDIAVLQVSENFKFSVKVKPIKLPSKCPEPNTTVIATGYGDTHLEESGETNGHLMAGILYWQKENVCKEAYSKFPITWTPRMACAYNQGKTTLCDGDWSDPLVYKDVVYGLFTSNAAEGFCTSHSKPCIMTSVCSFVKWIQTTIEATK